MNPTPNEETSEEKRGTPWWETAILAGSFPALWGWWLARQAAYRKPGGLYENPIWFGWHVLLGLSLLALVVVMVRRVRRVREALRPGLSPRYPGVPGMPPGGFTRNGGPKDANGHNGKPHTNREIRRRKNNERN